MPDDVMELATAERRDLADLLEPLDSAQWEASSLCAGWRVRDVVAHVISYDVLTPVGLAGRLLRGRLTVDGANRVGVARLADRSTGELLGLLREHERPSGLTAALGGGSGSPTASSTTRTYAGRWACPVRCRRTASASH